MLFWRKLDSNAMCCFVFEALCCHDTLDLDTFLLNFLPENMLIVPSTPHMQLHFFRMAVLTGCGVAAVLIIISATAHAFRKRRTRRVFNVR